MSPTLIPALFLGDLNDPWILRIKETLPAHAVCLDCPEGLPEQLPDGMLPRVLILQRATLSQADMAGLRRFREQFPRSRLILIVSPLVRYQQLMVGALEVDAILPEATAGAVLARCVEQDTTLDRPAQRAQSVWILSTNHELGCWLSELCREAGISAQFVRGSSWQTIPSGSLVVWDVPSLEPDWTLRLQRLAEGRMVLALFSFADRELVQAAINAGASACLELPCDPGDLAFVLKRLTRQGGQPASSPIRRLSRCL